MEKNLGHKGFTLVEILVTVFVVAIGICGALMYFTSALYSAQVAQDVTVATTHAGYVLEEMQNLDSLTDIKSVNWPDWSAAAGLDSLPGEEVTVSYADPDADPLAIAVVVSWTRRNRDLNATLETEMTK